MLIFELGGGQSRLERPSELQMLTHKPHLRGSNRSNHRLRATIGAASLVLVAGLMRAAGTASVQEPGIDPCPRPAAGSSVPEPEDLRSQNGVLKLDLAIHNYREADGSSRYCYLLPDGTEAPTLRLHPGDLLVLHLKNDLADLQSAIGVPAGAAPFDSGPMCTTKPKTTSDACASGAMTATSTNLHFHGLTVPPVCHQDDVLKTSVQPSDPAFEYRFQIPRDEPPGLYWYHPHIHGFSSKQVSGGASGALIVEGLERANSVVAGLPERVLVIRDQDLLNPDAPPPNPSLVPRMIIDRDGDTVNNGTGLGRPARDLSVNFVPVPYPDYPPASIMMKPAERQLWRVLNASAITYLDLALLYQGVPQQLGVVAIDGVPINGANGGAPQISGFNHIGVPPGARVEFIVTGPPIGIPGVLLTRTIDTGQGGENDPNRPLASIIASANAPEPQSTLPKSHEPLAPSGTPWLGTVTPTHVRKLYFSEKLEDPSNPNSATTFYITVEGQTPAPFDPNSDVPNIVVNQGDVEDWIIENRTNELHAFHIHQIHFQLMDWSGAPVNEPFLRDVVNVPYFNGRTAQYPSVRLRMDFRDPNTVGTFVYHCHLLEHEDGGMMGTVRVISAAQAAASPVQQ
jgi:FtsP/CotA-like multicopper oxidase with cupredoxin domain